MPRYTDDSRERVRDAVDFVELVGARTELKPAGPRRMTGLCPFHDERTPSFGIDPVEKLYHCFGCGKGGDVITFVRETESLDFAGAVEWLAERFRVTLEYEESSPQVEAARGRCPCGPSRVVGLDVARVAAITGKRPGAVRVFTHRGLRRLTERLGELLRQRAL